MKEKKKMDSLNIFFSEEKSGLGNLKINGNNRSIFSQTQKNLQLHFNFGSKKQFDTTHLKKGVFQDRKNSKNSPILTNSISSSGQKSKTINADFQTQNEVNYKAIIEEKDKKIAKLKNELTYYKNLVSFTRDEQNSSYNGPNRIINIKTSHKFPNKKSNLNLKSSFDYNLKYHERLLSERISKFYTPKANDIIRNINKTIQRGNSASSYTKKKKKEKSKNDSAKNDMMSTHLTTTRDQGNILTSSCNNYNGNNYISSFNSLQSRVNNLIKKLFKYINERKED